MKAIFARVSVLHTLGVCIFVIAPSYAATDSRQESGQPVDGMLMLLPTTTPSMPVPEGRSATEYVELARESVRLGTKSQEHRLTGGIGGPYYQRAIECYGRALRLLARSRNTDLEASIIAERAWLQYHLSEKREAELALRSLKRALELSPERVPTLVKLAVVEYQLHDPEGMEQTHLATAHRYLERAIQLDPKTADAYWMLAEVSRAQRNTGGEAGKNDAVLLNYMRFQKWSDHIIPELYLHDSWMVQIRKAAVRDTIDRVPTAERQRAQRVVDREVQR